MSARLLVVACLVVAALAVRAIGLGDRALAVDEAESSINALSILERGYPADRYLGAPIYENMLVRPWPDHPEYEFRDISYSDRGMAVYHSWLPLAAIAASFKLFGVTPPPAVGREGWHVPIAPAAWHRKTLAARMPSLVFSGAFLAFMFLAGRRLAGDDVGLAALALAGFSTSLIEATTHARYYSLMLALSAGGLLTLWRVLTAGGWRDHALHGVALVALFHTHMLAFATMAAMTAVGAAAWQRSARTAFRLATVGLLVALAALPWLVLSGFLAHLGELPSGRQLLDFPRDFVVYADERVPYVVLYAIGFAWFAFVLVLHGRVPTWIAEPWDRHSRPYLLLVVWMAIGSLVWFFFSPPASLFAQRLSLTLFVPGVLLMAMLLADISRNLAPARAVWLAPALALGFLAVIGRVGPQARTPPFDGLAATFEALNALQLPDRARVYASPSSQLILGFYGERPFQSIAPIRRSFLESYPHDIVYLDSRYDYEFLSPDRAAIARAAARRGQRLTDAEAQDWARQLKDRLILESVSSVRPQALALLPPFAQDALEEVRREAGGRAAESLREYSRGPIFRGFPLETSTDVWQVFFYRLVDPVRRSGAGFNAAGRLSCAQVRLVPAAWLVLFHSPTPCGSHGN